ncbi:hypothetical protein CLV62_102172 [Dysgonomonas alginatilytica]|uniref:Uncharacterized protein n=1 Tax=Dysgonomonas alginatilytica TaxID=1605892 RepID=A0A2V3PSJ0_9BACT|nr:hypothetical protein [Dysgonomonas alginatilytica]PXV68140.1 hypothetical protein CLV62_102172 [Dysgonomonas alginatilytica]
MELTELENIWRESDKKIADNTRLNKEILKRMLMSKPEKRLHRMKIKVVYNVLSPVILFIVLVIIDFQFRLTVNFYIGLSLFVFIYVINYIWDIKYFLLIRNIDFSDKTLTLKKKFAKLEKYTIKTSKIRHLLMPFAILAALLMLFQKFVFNIESIVMLILIVLVFIASTYYRFRYAIFERFKKLNKEIEEIENLEKE